VDDSAIAQLFKRRASFVPGSTIQWGLSDNGTVAVGYTNDAEHPESYQIGSITKALTGTLLAVLVQRGEVRLDHSIADLSGLDLPAEVGSITLEELATHRSGLPRLPAALCHADHSNPYAAYDQDSVLSFLSSVSSGSIIDGRGAFEYSNFGVSILGALLAIATGQSYATLLKTEVFVPLGMHETFADIAELPSSSHTSLRGMSADGVTQSPWQFGGFAPAGGVVSRVADLVLLAEAMLFGTSLIATALREAARPRFSSPNSGTVGLCWMADDSVIWHNGETNGYHAMIAISPQRKRAAVGLWNAAYTLDDLCMHIVEPTRVVHRLPDEVRVPSDVLARYIGTYKDIYNRAYSVRIDGRRLIVDAPGNVQFCLYGLDERTFFAKSFPDSSFAFAVDSIGRTTGFEQTHFGLTLLRMKRCYAED
jgi:serine-type D-Ala-D-Ala carboxypeptidase/endopeptidase